MWMVAPFLGLFFVLVGRAGLAALFQNSSARRRDAYRVLKLLIGVVSASGIAILTSLHEAGVIS
ncbi:hypothetical protein [Amycolatopsis jejuensis]|uniref:hypothetical protein n=1 Tax=Amycolatopsis jejuensis TaxID=330084 RepID=UPI000526CB3D|nr:hypothetical protein [Amycolatopsis jejuensis]